LGQGIVRKGNGKERGHDHVARRKRRSRKVRNGRIWDRVRKGVGR